MQMRFFRFASRGARRALTLLAVFILAACSSQAAPQLVPVTGASSGAQSTSAAQPSTNQPSAAYPAASQPDATQVGAGATQPAAVAYPPISPGEASTPASAGASSTPAAACAAPAALTPAVMEGPYFKAGSPERANLLDPGLTGITLTLTGTVYSADCQPVAHALLDFWQANAQGQYDNAGYTLRGHQYTDASGRFQLVTVVPGLYPGRTEHIHVKVQAPGGPILTTQLFFPGVTDNSADGIYNPGLLINVQSNDANTMQASFNFVISAK